MCKKILHNTVLAQYRTFHNSLMRKMQSTVIIEIYIAVRIDILPQYSLFPYCESSSILYLCFGIVLHVLLDNILKIFCNKDESPTKINNWCHLVDRYIFW